MSKIAKTVAEDYGVQSILEYKSAWRVSIGFATGNPVIPDDTDWFIIEESSENCFIQDIVFNVLSGAYSSNDDICAHWFFGIWDDDGKKASDIEELLVMKRVKRMQKNPV